MRTLTEQKIMETIQREGMVRPATLADQTGLSTQAVHWQLRKLLAAGKIERRGKPPHSVYAIKAPAYDFPSLSMESEQLIQDEFTYLDPAGGLIEGLDAFRRWIQSKKLVKDYSKLAVAYQKMWHEVYGDKKISPIDTVQRLIAILGHIELKTVMISDFYALPQFGKSRLGNYVHAAKVSSQPKFIREIADIVSEDVKQLLHQHRIQGICYVPHSIPRINPLLPGLAKQFAFGLSEVVCKKVFFGSVPVPQKSLSKLSERIENAGRTIFIESAPKGIDRLLIIDDAIGSGATMNEMAKLFLAKKICKEVHGYAVVGSYKGFDVISQI